MKKRIVLVFLLVIALFAIIPTVARSPQETLEVPPSPSPSPAPVLTPTQNPASVFSPVPAPAPTRDLYGLTFRLRPDVKGPIPRMVNKESPQYTQGQKQTFWLTDLAEYKHFSVTTTLRFVSPHAYFYVEDGTGISDDEVRRGADDFEKIVLPSDRKYFGNESMPGVDNDPHLTIVVARFPGAAGYYSMADEYPKAVNPYSNEREMIYIGLPGLRPGTRGFASTLAHEYEHAIHWSQQPDQETWISEGMAELAAALAGYSPVGASAFLKAPDTQLTGWSDEPNGVHRYYGGAYLFVRYLFQHYGGYESIKDFLAERGPGARGINSYLKKKGYAVDFDGVFKDWVIANYLDEAGNGRYSYPDDDVKVATEGTIKDSREMAASVSQYGTDYYEIEISAGEATVNFHGEPLIRLVATNPHGGRFQWYGNRGDSIDSTLTREFDLSGLRTATLKFWAWYDIEEKWDYAYVEASVDGGTTWTTLPGLYTTKEDPVGNSFGNGYTGTSGGRGKPEWEEETIDLSPYAGKKFLLRFEYVTDEGLNRPGFAIDDIFVPELGFRDDAESDAGWKAEGFVRTSNLLTQRFSVQVIKSGANGNSVETMQLGNGEDGQMVIRGFGEDLRKAILAISGLTPVTSETAQYRFSVSVAQ